jgi:hypothetical protein
MEIENFTLDSVELDGTKYVIEPTPYPIARLYGASSLEIKGESQLTKTDYNKIDSRFDEIDYYEAYGDNYTSELAFFARCEDVGLRQASNDSLFGEYVGAVCYEINYKDDRGNYGKIWDQIWVVFYQDDECYEGECEHAKTEDKCLVVKAERVEFERQTLWLYGGR